MWQRRPPCPGLLLRLRYATAAVLAGLSLAALAQPITVRDDRGTQHLLPAPPQRVISMMPSLTELASVLGIGSRLVGVDRYSNWPVDVARLPRLGGLDDAQIEAIAALKPDVILASTSSRAMDRLEALGFKVIRFRSDSHEDIRRSLGTLALVLGRAGEGDRIWAQLQSELDAAASRVPLHLRGQRVYFEIGGGPYAAGSSSFIGETLTRMGMRNIVPAEMGPFPKLNPEFVVRAKPDLIMGQQREQAALLRRPGWSSLAAAREQRLCGFSAEAYELMVRPGPRLGEAARLLADCLERLGSPTGAASR